MANTFTFCLYFHANRAGRDPALIIDVCPTHQQRDANAWWFALAVLPTYWHICQLFWICLNIYLCLETLIKI